MGFFTGLVTAWATAWGRRGAISRPSASGGGYRPHTPNKSAFGLRLAPATFRQEASTSTALPLVIDSAMFHLAERPTEIGIEPKTWNRVPIGIGMGGTLTWAYGIEVHVPQCGTCATLWKKCATLWQKCATFWHMCHIVAHVPDCGTCGGASRLASLLALSWANRPY